MIKGSHHTEEMKKYIGETLKSLHLRHSETTKQIMREQKIGNKNPAKRLDVREKISNALKGHTPPNKGKKMSDGQRKNISDRMSGANSHRWKGGITSLQMQIRNTAEFSLWRKSVYVRDNFSCQKCGCSGGNLNAHHIYNFADYPELRFAINNGITLCKICHKNFHKKYGKKNNTKEQLENWAALN
jgi:hypothetical protein